MKKSPKAILTNQDPWITEAISKELPSTKHAFCIWYITAKFSGWFTTILRSQYSNWYMDFYKLYKLDSCEEFEHQWSQVMAKYDMPFGIFVGITNHGKTILFGYALLRNETTSAFQ